MKKLVSILIAMIMVISLVPMTVFAEDYSSDESISAAKTTYGQTGNNLFWWVGASATEDSVYAYLTTEDSGTTYTLHIVGEGAMTTKWTNENDTNEWHNASYKEKITDLEIAEGVTSISQYAFPAHTALKNVTFADNSQLKTIGNRAFMQDSALTGELKIPASVTEISDMYAFTETGITSLTFEDNSQLTTLGKYAFRSCESLESVIFGENSMLKTIDQEAFAGCKNLQNITIPASVETIGLSAFYESGLQSVIFEEGTSSILNIGDNAFEGCENLETLLISTSVRYMGTAAFKDCLNLSSVTIPSSVKVSASESYGPFYNCNSITQATIGDASYMVPSGIAGNITLGRRSDVGTITAPEGTMVSMNGYSFKLGKQLLSTGSSAKMWTAVYAVTKGTEIATPIGPKTLTKQVSVDVKSLQKLIDALDRPEVSATEVTANSIKLTYNENWEYKLSTNSSWNSAENANAFTGLDAATEYKFDVRVKDRDGTKVTVTQYTAVATPTASVAAGTYTSAQNVVLSTATEGAAIYYTTDGIDPTTSSTIYTEAIAVSETTTIKAIAVKDGCPDSDVLTATYTIKENTPGGGGSSTYYSVATKSSKNGTIAIDKTKAASGTTVTITVKPDSGFTVEKVTVLDKNGKEVTVKNLGNDKYSFTMPKGGVTVLATFMEDNTMLNFFVDVNADDYFYDAVLWAAENGITTGTDAIHFSPNGTTTRAQMVTFIWRLAGSPDFEGGDTPFTDITKSDYFYDAVVWGWNVGIINGKSETLFAPDDIVTRGEAVTFIYRYAKVAGGDLPNPFTDVTLGKFYYYPVLWAANNEIVKGTSATTFSPDAECTRGQVVTFLYRYNNQYSIQ